MQTFNFDFNKWKSNGVVVALMVLMDTFDHADRLCLQEVPNEFFGLQELLIVSNLKQRQKV